MLDFAALVSSHTLLPEFIIHTQTCCTCREVWIWDRESSLGIKEGKTGQLPLCTHYEPDTFHPHFGVRKVHQELHLSHEEDLGARRSGAGRAGERMLSCQVSSSWFKEQAENERVKPLIASCDGSIPLYHASTNWHSSGTCASYTSWLSSKVNDLHWDASEYCPKSGFSWTDSRHNLSVDWSHSAPYNIRLSANPMWKVQDFLNFWKS